jgi:hypothetical protein
MVATVETTIRAIMTVIETPPYGLKGGFHANLLAPELLLDALFPFFLGYHASLPFTEPLG